MKVSFIACMLMAAVSVEAISLHKLDIKKLRDFRTTQSLAQAKTGKGFDDLVEKIRNDGVVLIGEGSQLEEAKKCLDEL